MESSLCAESTDPFYMKIKLDQAIEKIYFSILLNFHCTNDSRAFKVTHDTRWGLLPDLLDAMYLHEV